jgi:iron complex outermembrane receptor protein
VGHSAPEFAFLPESLGQTWASLFAQDEITLTDTLHLTLGARVERNDYTGAEFLPNLRLAWKVSPQQLWWASLARTVRAPSRLDRDAYIPAQPPYLLNGGPNFRSETARVLEAGYRGQPTTLLSLSATAFLSDYDHLHTQELAPSRTSIYFGNGMRGRVDGLETWASLQATAALRLHAGFTRLWPRLELKPGSTDTAASVAAAEGAMPRHQAQLRASLDLPRGAELDLQLRHVSALTAPAVPAYTAADLRLGLRIAADTELSLTARNLGGGHGEFGPIDTRSEFRRGFFVQLRTQTR